MTQKGDQALFSEELDEEKRTEAITDFVASMFQDTKIERKLLSGNKRAKIDNEAKRSELELKNRDEVAMLQPNRPGRAERSVARTRRRTHTKQERKSKQCGMGSNSHKKIALLSIGLSWLVANARLTR